VAPTNKPIYIIIVLFWKAKTPAEMQQGRGLTASPAFGAARALDDRDGGRAQAKVPAQRDHAPTRRLARTAGANADHCPTTPRSAQARYRNLNSSRTARRRPNTPRPASSVAYLPGFLANGLIAGLLGLCAAL
jgi:hypothetical protein